MRERGVDPAQAIWVRRRALRGAPPARHARFSWQTPPSFAGRPNVANIAARPNPAERTALAKTWIQSVLTIWSAVQPGLIARWYDAYVLPERLE